MAGFYGSFANKRVQVIGRHEVSYLNSLTASQQRESIKLFFASKIPCVVFARSIKPPKIFLQEAENYAVPVFTSPLITMRLVNSATICLELDFSPAASEHGSMVDIQGVGVMIRGKSGIGKSEAVLGLIERGYSLVADDVCKFRLIEGREIVGTSADLTRHHMEIRGIGIIHVGSMFGAGSVRLEKNLDLVVTFMTWEEAEATGIDRTGIDQKYYEILGIRLPHAIIPVRPGRDMARLVEVAALDEKLKQMGQNSAVEFNRKLISLMQVG